MAIGPLSTAADSGEEQHEDRRSRPGIRLLVELAEGDTTSGAEQVDHHVRSYSSHRPGSKYEQEALVRRVEGEFCTSHPDAVRPFDSLYFAGRTKDI